MFTAFSPLGKLGAPRWRELLMPDLLAEVACGGVSTAAVSAALNPVDVIKTRRISPTHSTAHTAHTARPTHTKQPVHCCSPVSLGSI